MCHNCSSQPRGRLIGLSEAVGAVLAHDLTEVRPGCFKGPAFKKGHLVREEDLDRLARLGKRHLYVLDLDEGLLHEDDAALVLAGALAGEGVTFNPQPAEGKINLKAAHDGLLKVNVEALTEFNLVEGVMCAGRHTNTRVKQGEIVAGARAIPLVVPREQVETAAGLARAVGGVFSVREMARPRTGLIITGHEVYHGLIEDRFERIMVPKLESFGCPVIRVSLAPDEVEFIAATIIENIRAGAELVVLTGGLSVDPDDVTRAGVLRAGGAQVLYGSSVLPGAMLLLARINGTPVVGVPACGLFHERTIFDLVLPRLLAGENLTRRDLAVLGHGGLCLNCAECRFPCCPFGKAG
ncbi:MAG: molybdopterin-binding protein [Thermodesulfobacteriota bacterium]